VSALCDEICRRLDQLDAVVIQPALTTKSGEPKSVALFRFRKGELAGPELFAVETEDSSVTLDQRLREFLQKFTPPGARSAQQFMEELAMLKRWYYRSHKVGEIVLAKAGGELSIRKIANAVMRVHRNEKESKGTTPEAAAGEDPSAGEKPNVE
jgi:hypothetical protein